MDVYVATTAVVTARDVWEAAHAEFRRCEAASKEAYTAMIATPEGRVYGEAIMRELEAKRVRDNAHVAYLDELAQRAAHV